MIIKCPECGNDVSDKASTCPHCGNPINVILSTNHNEEPGEILNIEERKTEEEKLFCPYCLSSMVQFNKKGFGAGKAVAGVLLTGGIGALAGTLGMNKIHGRCAKCNKTFTAAEAVQSTQSDVDDVKKYIVDNYGKLYDSDIRSFMTSRLKNVKPIEALINIKSEKNITKSAKKTEGEKKAGIFFIVIMVILAIVFIRMCS